MNWIKRFILFHGKRHPQDLGAPEVAEFVSSLAIDRNVSASTQNQALAAILFLYKAVLEIDLPWMKVVTRAKKPQQLPTVLTVDDVSRCWVRFMARAVRSTACCAVQRLPARRDRGCLSAGDDGSDLQGAAAIRSRSRANP